jgi:CRISPR/Cas system CSM-associated protein Csm2 small subunit
MNKQVEIKAEQIARMIVSGMLITRVAEQMGLSYSGLRRILACPEYQEIENRVRKTVVGRMDEVLDKRAQLRSQLREEMEDLVPDAMKVLVEQVKQKRDLRAALEALDRDPQRTLSKQNNVSLPQQTPSIPASVLDTAVRDAELAREILIRVPQGKTAEA